MYYILVGKTPIKVELEQWAQWFGEQSQNGGRIVAKTEIGPRKPFRKGGKMLAKVNRLRAQEFTISTVFLGLDHNHFGGEPILFETMIFGGPYDSYMWRFKSWDDSKVFHDTLVKRFGNG